MKRTALIALLAAGLCTSAVAQTTGALPTEEGPRAAACTAILSAVSGTVRPSSADMANELDELARRWRAKAEAVYKAKEQRALGEQMISDQSMALIGKQGLPSGTFDKAATCQVEGSKLPPA